MVKSYLNTRILIRTQKDVRWQVAHFWIKDLFNEKEEYGLDNP